MIGAQALAAALPGAVARAQTPLQGGDLSEVWAVDLRDGPRVAVKRGARVAQEAAMLRALVAAGAPCPHILGQAGEILALEFLPPCPAAPEAWAELGQSLRKLHDLPGAAYGWDEPYGFGAVAIVNRPCDDWPAFWATRRLAPLAPSLPQALRARLDRLTAQLPDLLPQHPTAGLLHGDLWSGNIHFSGGRAWLIDPACYRGHGEVDLAMLTLFGTPPPGFWEGYGTQTPGAVTRRAIYQLWPALVHVALFGSGYLGLVETCLSRAEAS